MALRGSGSHDFFYGIPGPTPEDANLTTILAPTTLLRDHFYKNLTIGNIITETVLNPNGFRIYVKEKLTIWGHIRRIGNNGAPGQTPGPGGAGGAALAPHSVGGSSAGGAGGAVNTPGDPGGGSPNGRGGDGGTGGNGDSQAGGGPGLVSWNEDDGGTQGFLTGISGMAMGLSGLIQIQGGAGGGGGGGSDTPGAGDSSSGPGGAGGGGVIYIAAREIVFANAVASVDIYGGRGRNGRTANGVHSGSGSGGGGGTGIILASHIDYNGQTPVFRFKSFGGDAGISAGGGAFQGTGGRGGRTYVFGEFEQYIIAGQDGGVSDDGL